MYENMESMTPVGGNTMPSRLKRGSRRGADIDLLFKEFDREEILRKISTYPPSERRMLFNLLRQTSHDR